MASAKYVLLWNEKLGMELHKISREGPRLITKQELLVMDYPKPSADKYYIYELDFENRVSINLDSSLLEKLKALSYKPRCIALEDLIMGKI